MGYLIAALVILLAVVIIFGWYDQATTAANIDDRDPIDEHLEN